MNGILIFFTNHYLVFLIISLVLIFALIGYFVDTKPDERFLQKIELDKELESRLAIAEATNLTLNQMVNNPLPGVKSAAAAPEANVESLEANTQAPAPAPTPTPTTGKSSSK